MKSSAGDLMVKMRRNKIKYPIGKKVHRISRRCVSAVCLDVIPHSNYIWVFIEGFHERRSSV